MEAKDTVMKTGKLCIKVCQEHRSRTLEAKDCSTGLDCEECQLEAQAEISFKAGMKDLEGRCLASFYDGRKRRMREVVERIDNTGLIEHTDSPLHETGATIIDCPACCWYAYKKEWGIV